MISTTRQGFCLFALRLTASAYGMITKLPEGLYSAHMLLSPCPGATSVHNKHNCCPPRSCTSTVYRGRELKGIASCVKHVDFFGESSADPADGAVGGEHSVTPEEVLADQTGGPVLHRSGRPSFVRHLAT